MPLPTTQSETSRVLPSGWVDRLFERFAAMYGKHWFDQWAQTPMDDVKAVWAEDLAGMSGEQIRKALDHCKANNKFPPTCPEFAGLCKAFAPAMETGNRLPAPRGGEMDPKVRAEIARFLDPQRKRDPKDWARQILKEHAAGTYRHLVGIENARRALGLVAS